MAKTVTVRIEESIYRRIKAAAESERRTISNFMEYATVSYVENSSLADPDEMRGISEEKELLSNLTRAMDDIKRGKYRLVR